jgi:hypothetical protein
MDVKPGVGLDVDAISRVAAGDGGRDLGGDRAGGGADGEGAGDGDELEGEGQRLVGDDEL